MTRPPTAPLLRFLRGLAGRPLADAEGDARLLQRFGDAGDAAAFAAILQRYGPLVWGVCRRMLHHEQDAEDAFQATFLVLVRKAPSVRRQGSLRSWLYGVALRVAARARDTRRRHPRTGPPEGLPEPAGPRPRGFEAGEGPGRFLLVLERLEPPRPEARPPGGGKKDPETLRRENQLLRVRLDRAQKIINDLRLHGAAKEAEMQTRLLEMDLRQLESQKKIDQLEKEVKRLKQGKEPGGKE